MARKKKIIGKIKLYCPGGQANPAPPVGPALGQYGVKIMDFCKQFNDQTKDKQGLTLPVVIDVYEDKSFSFIVKNPPTSVLLKRESGIAKASGVPHKEKVAKLTKDQINKIAKEKIDDLNAIDLDAAVKIIEGTARSMGIDIVKDASELDNDEESQEEDENV